MATTKTKAPRRKGAGAPRQLPSGRWQARFTGPDGVMRPAGQTFDTQLDAEAWITAQARDVHLGIWTPRAGKASTGNLRGYAESWLATRELKPRTRWQYRKILDAAILPHLGDVPLDRLTPETVRNWYAKLNADTPTWRAQSYSLLRSICATAYAEDIISANPCRIRGGGKAKKAHSTKVASLPELAVIVEAMPDRYQAMVLLAAWCGLRFGELIELRRKDITLDVNKQTGFVRVERGAVRVDGEVIVGDPKSEAGRRRVALPPHLVDVIAAHLDDHVEEDPEALLFPARHGGHMAPASLYKVFYPARDKAGRSDLRFHDLRHTGATLAAATGATIADLMARLGHSTQEAAMRYQHAAEDRDQLIAEALSGFATAKAVPLKAKGKRTTT